MNRERFLQLVVSQIGAISCWAHRGPTVFGGPMVFDCSGLVTWALHESGGPDFRKTHTARRLFAESAPVAMPAAGDLGFFGRDDISHVVIFDGTGEDVMNAIPFISADGATSRVLDVVSAQKIESARVRRHLSIAASKRAFFRGARNLSSLAAK